MSDHDLNDDFDPEWLGQLIERIEAPVQPSPKFRRGLETELRRRLAARRGEAPAPEGWALCPFDVFCVAEQPLPRALRANCPCLHAAPLLRLLQSRGSPIRMRPCAGLAVRKGNAVLSE